MRLCALCGATPFYSGATLHGASARMRNPAPLHDRPSTIRIEASLQHRKHDRKITSQAKRGCRNVAALQMPTHVPGECDLLILRNAAHLLPKTQHPSPPSTFHTSAAPNNTLPLFPLVFLLTPSQFLNPLSPLSPSPPCPTLSHTTISSLLLTTTTTIASTTTTTTTTTTITTTTTTTANYYDYYYYYYC